MPMMIGLGLGVTIGTGGGGSSGPALVPIGSTWGITGDGIISNASSAGVRNIPFWLMNGLKGRLQASVLPIVALSGTTIARDDGSNTAFIVPIAIPALAAQYVDVPFFGSCGANDNLLSTNPVGSVPLQDWKDAVTLHVASNPQAKLIPICGTGPSIKTNEATYRAANWAAQAAHVASLNDPRCLYIDVSSIDPTTWSPASDGSRVHPDERGAQAYANLILAAIDSRIESKTVAEILDMIYGNTYPGMVTQLDTDRALAGTGGTVTNMFAGSVAPTSKLATNLTGSTAIASGVVAIPSSRQKMVVTLGGTVTADGKVMMQDKSNLVLTGATPGQFVASGMVVRAAAGFINAGIDFGNYGTVASGANSQAGVVTTAPVANAIDSLWICFGLPLAGTPLQGKRAVAFRYPAGAAPAGTFETEQWFAWVISRRLLGPPVYLGNVSVVGVGNKTRVTGSIAAGFRLEPGYWNLAGLTEADFVQRRIYKGGTATIGSGTLIATMSGSTWTTTAAAAGIIAGDVLWAETDCNNGIGGTVTARSATGLTAA